ncbi:MAG: hypothetical protein ABI554_14730 [Flavobacterium sp.]
MLVLFCVVLVRFHIYKITNYQKDLHFQKVITSSILESEEELRGPIASDLHDDIGQQITILNFQIENFKLDYPELQLPFYKLSILEPV